MEILISSKSGNIVTKNHKSKKNLSLKHRRDHSFIAILCEFNMSSVCLSVCLVYISMASPSMTVFEKVRSVVTSPPMTVFEKLLPILNCYYSENRFIKGFTWKSTTTFSPRTLLRPQRIIDKFWALLTAKTVITLLWDVNVILWAVITPLRQ